MLGKKVITTNPDTAQPCPDDKVNRAFVADMPNQLWVSDFTYVSSWQGMVYVAFIIDVFARKIVGWRVSTSMTTGFVSDALNQAICQRTPSEADKLIHHSDRGSQYLSIRYTERLAEAGIDTSVAAIVTRTDGVPRRPSGIPMTMPWPKRSMACSKPKSFTDAGHGAVLRPSNTRPWNGSIGSTIAACWSLSGISRQMKQRQTSMPLWKDQTWPRNQDKSASGKSGAVQNGTASRPCPRRALALE